MCFHHVFVQFVLCAAVEKTFQHFNGTFSVYSVYSACGRIFVNSLMHLNVFQVDI